MGDGGAGAGAGAGENEHAAARGRRTVIEAVHTGRKEQKEQARIFHCHHSFQIVMDT